MNAVDLYPSLLLFKSIIGLEDDITVDPPQESKGDDPNSKREKAAAFFGKLKQAAAEKKALVKRTHSASLVVLTDYNAKPYVFTVGKTWDVVFAQPNSGSDPKFTHFTIITAVTDPNDSAVSRPDAVYNIPCDHVVEVQIQDAEQSFMAAASNALAEHPSASAQKIIELVGLKQVVEQAKMEQARSQATSDQGQIQILWYPVYGWSTPNMTPINGPLPDPITTYPLQPIMPATLAPTSTASAQGGNNG